MPPKRACLASPPRFDCATEPLVAPDADVPLFFAGEWPPVPSALDMISGEVFAALLEERRNRGSRLGQLAGDMFRSLMLERYVRKKPSIVDSPRLSVEFGGRTTNSRAYSYWMCHRNGVAHFMIPAITSGDAHPACVIVKLDSNNNTTLTPLAIPERGMMRSIGHCSAARGRSCVVLGEIVAGRLAFFAEDCNDWLRVFSYEGEYIMSYKRNGLSSKGAILAISHAVHPSGLVCFKLIVLLETSICIAWHWITDFNEVCYRQIPIENDQTVHALGDGVILGSLATEDRLGVMAQTPDGKYYANSLSGPVLVDRAVAVLVARTADDRVLHELVFDCQAQLGATLTMGMPSANSVVLLITRAVCGQSSDSKPILEVFVRVVQ